MGDPTPPPELQESTETELMMDWLAFAGMFAIAAYVLWHTRLPAALRLAAFAPFVASVLGILVVVVPATRRTVMPDIVDMCLPWIERAYLWAPLGAAALRAILGRRRDARGLWSTVVDVASGETVPDGSASVFRDMGVMLHHVTGQTFNISVQNHNARRRYVSDGVDEQELLR